MVNHATIAAAPVAVSLQASLYETVIPAQWYNYEIPFSILAQVFGMSEQDNFILIEERAYLYELGIVKAGEAPRMSFSSLVNSYLNLNSYSGGSAESDAEWRALRYKLAKEIHKYVSRSSVQSVITSWHKCFEIKRRALKGHDKLVASILRLKTPDFNAIVYKSVIEILGSVEYVPTTPLELSDKIIGSIMTRISNGAWSFTLMPDAKAELDQLLKSYLSGSEKQVIELSFGIGEYQLSMPKSSDALNVSDSKFYRIRDAALKKIRKNPELKAKIAIMASVPNTVE